MRTALHYYSHPLFRKVDLALLRAYFLHNPYVISRRYLETKGEIDLHTYGETPITTIDLIAKECELTNWDTIYELGCGRGRTCFYLALILQATVVGIDFVPTFIDKALRLTKRFALKNPTFRCKNFLKTSLDKATVCYLHGTCLPDADIIRLMEHLRYLPQGAKVITVSFSLMDYPGGKDWEVRKSFQAPFTWGTAEVYLHIKR